MFDISFLQTAQLILSENIMLFGYFWDHFAKIAKKVFVNDRFYKVFLQKRNRCWKCFINDRFYKGFSFLQSHSFLFKFDRFYKGLWLPFCVKDQ